MKSLNIIFKASFIVAITTTVVGCKFGPNFQKPSPKTNAHFINDSLQTDSTNNISWWEMFEDPKLDTLIKIGLDSNKDILIAAARIEEYRSIVGLKKGEALPAFGYQANGTYGNYNGFLSDDPGGAGFGGLAMNWEIDFWGKYRRATESAKADLLANQFAQRSVQISLISEIATSYFTILDYQWRLEISKATVQLRKENVDIIRQKFNAGLVPEIDLNNAQLQYAIALAAVPNYTRLLAFEQTTMSVLLGFNPRSIVTGIDLENQPIPANIPPGLPSQLLLRRPDIAFSEAKYHSQMAKIGVAQAKRFPSIGLTGLLGGASSSLGAFTGAGLAWNAGSTIVGPIFQFGLNKRRVEIEVARTEQAKREYEQTVIESFKEVEDALVSVSTYNNEVKARQLQASSAINAQTLSQLRYNKGVTSYLEVITLQGYAFDAELSLSSTRRALFESYIKLYKALGGGWISEDEKKTAEENEQEPNDLPKIEE